MNPLQAEVRLSRMTGGSKNERWRLTLTDTLSRCRAVEVSLSDDQIARLLASQGVIGPAVWTTRLDRIGRSHENKVISLACDGWLSDEEYTERIAKEQAILDAEGEGWELDDSGWNHHRARRTTGAGYLHEAVARRWVEADTDA